MIRTLLNHFESYVIDCPFSADRFSNRLMRMRDNLIRQRKEKILQNSQIPKLDYFLTHANCLSIFTTTADKLKSLTIVSGARNRSSKLGSREKNFDTFNSNIKL